VNGPKGQAVGVTMTSMIMHRFEVGLVSADRKSVDFYVEVFDLEELPPEIHPPGTLYRLQAPGSLLKVMVPNESPEPNLEESFLARIGLRYLSVWVSDLNMVMGRAAARGAKVLLEPTIVGPGRRLAVIVDPDGNTIEVGQDDGVPDG
jgi:predicted enzyme related to lactoylglutathione lyase